MDHSIDALRHWWLTSGATVRLVAINAAVFTLLHLLAAANIFTGDRSVEAAALRMVELPSELATFAMRPWTIATYMFAQFDVFHFLFNMVWLYWFGKFFEEISSKLRTTLLYLSGGAGGGLAFLLASNLTSTTGGYLIGSSAAVLAVAAATAIITPNREIRLIFLGNVKLKWIALILLAIDLVNIGNTYNMSHIAHIGGALVGVVYGTAKSRITLSRIFKNMKVEPARNSSTHPSTATADYTEDDLNRLLDKIKTSGYSSLSTDERETLNIISSQLRGRKPTTKNFY